MTNSQLSLGEPERDYLGAEPSRNVATSDYLGLGEGICEGYTRKVREMLLKEALEQKKAEDAAKLEAFQKG